MASIANRDIPQEIINEIIDNLVAIATTQRVSLKATLSPVALVCHAFVKQCQRHLFSSVQIADVSCWHAELRRESPQHVSTACTVCENDSKRIDYYSQKVAFYKTKPGKDIAGLVRSLRLGIDIMYPIHSPVKTYVTELLDILKKSGGRFTALELFHVARNGICRWGPALSNLFTENINQALITELHIRSLYDVPADFFDGFSGLEVLQLTDTYIKGDSIAGPVTVASKPRPEHLYIGNPFTVPSKLVLGGGILPPSYWLISKRGTFDLSRLQTLGIHNFEDSELLDMCLSQSLQAARSSLTTFIARLAPSVQYSPAWSQFLDLRDFVQLSRFGIQSSEYIPRVLRRSGLASSIGAPEKVLRFLELIQLPMTVNELGITMLLIHSDSAPVSQADGTLDEVLQMGWKQLDAFFVQEFIGNQKIRFRRVVFNVHHGMFQYQTHPDGVAPAMPPLSGPLGTSAADAQLLGTGGRPAIPSEHDEAAMKRAYISSFEARMDACFPLLRQHLGENFSLVNHDLY